MKTNLNKTAKKRVSRWIGRWRKGRGNSHSSNLPNLAAWEAGGLQAITETEEQDVFVVGFPKSGNTWMQNLIAGVLYGIDTKYLPDKLTQLLVPNVHGKFGYYKRIGDVTAFKSHSLPIPQYRRVVYLIRDGRDAMVSYHHMNRAVLENCPGLPEMVVNGEGVFPCKWWEHVDQWMSNPFDAEICTIRYEDLHKQPLIELRKFCEFAGIQRPDSVLQCSIEGNNFQRMQEKEKQFGWDNENWKSNEPFIREGKIGAYRREMPMELIHHFERESKSQLEMFGYSIERE